MVYQRAVREASPYEMSINSLRKEGNNMEPVYRNQFTITSAQCDPYGRIKPSAILSILQEAAGAHCEGTDVDWNALANRNLFFAVTRQRVQITRLPRHGQTVTVETWPGPTSRVAYPRNTIVRDELGNELLRAISLWVLMDVTTRAMVLPGKSGVDYSGNLRGGELPVPASIGLKPMVSAETRVVRYSELDRNHHMNNCRYLDWVMDLLPSAFHREHPVADFTVCYLSEAREGDRVELHYELADDGSFVVNGLMEKPGEPGAYHRIFAVRALCL